jgi:hypothetical protein
MGCAPSSGRAPLTAAIEGSAPFAARQTAPDNAISQGAQATQLTQAESSVMGLTITEDSAAN